jgi:peroxiredoxin
MEQVVDLQSSKAFQKLGVELLSISPDPVSAWEAEARQEAIRTPLLSDSGNHVASRYGVMQWKMPTNEPGHTFVLVDQNGHLAWFRDYGAPEHGGTMYVPPDDLVTQLQQHLRVS